MSIGEIFYQLIFMPLQLMFEQIYYIIGFKLTHDPGLSIIVLSLTVNLLVLPLYNRADAVQEEERVIDAKLRKGVEHIKKTFKGDEQLMMLQTYYRQNNYSPFDVIKGSISLFLEIPFFVAAYQFLSHLSILQGAALGPIKDLGMPDGLLQLAGMSINVLPLIMTAVNLLATLLFVDGLAMRTKLQLYGLAFFFLVFLYKSPSGLVFYWTLNNLFNLGKTIVYKFRKNKEAGNSKSAYAKPEGKLFFAGAVFMAILTGLLIPSSVISASPQEFMVVGYLNNPLWYLVASFALALGSFVLWLGVFYWLAETKGRLKFEFFVWAFSVIAIMTYLVWGKNSSLLTSNLVLANGLQLERTAKIVNIVLVLAIGAGLRYFWLRYRKHAFEIMALGSVALLGMSCLNIYTIKQSVATALNQKSDSIAADSDSNKLVLSKQGKNIIVLMIDGAIGAQVPYILKEKPELKGKFAGFTYYNNVISYGSHTLFGSPGIFGGYEYTPLEMNKRDKQPLKDKHNEAMLMLPLLFDKLGYKTTVSDLPLVNYQWIPDYTPFKKYPGIRIESYGKLEKAQQNEADILESIADNKRNFYCYGFMKSIPLVLQNIFYSSGTYTGFSRTKDQSVTTNLVYALGTPKTTRKDYLALESLPAKTKIIEDGNTFLSMTNDITHDNALLQMPNYTLQDKVDNSKLAELNGENYVIDGKRLLLENYEQVTKYHVNMAAFLKLGTWFDYLRAQGVYDNTRIILVSDHGFATKQVADLLFGEELGVKKVKGLNSGDATAYFALLMVKDFNSKDFVVSDSFMTNADVPTLAVKDIVAEPKNPFTGKIISSKEKLKPEQFIIESDEYELRYNQGNTYQNARWFAVKNNIWNKKDWRLAGEGVTLPK